MKGYKIVKPQTLKEVDIPEQEISTGKAKVKITKTLVTFSDYLKYMEGDKEESPILGRYGIGIVSETDTNFFGLEKGSHVYIDPFTPCGECYNCKNNERKKCSELLIAGEDSDGFLSDFYSVSPEKLHILPEVINDFDALFIGQISLAVSIIDTLKIQKGDYVSIVGGNNLANIIAQLLIYYQAVPIVATTDPEDFETLKNAGIYYVLGPEDNWQKEVMSITGGRMTNSVVYIADCDIPVVKAFSLASYNASVVFTGNSYKNNPISFNQAVRKQLDIHFLNVGLENTASSINLIANKAIDLSKLKYETANYSDVPKVFKNMATKFENENKTYETVIDV